MRRFEFRLESVREWRILQLDLEKARLERLFQELRAVQARGEALETEQGEAQREVLALTVLEAQQLAALEAHRRYVAAERERLRKLEQDCSRRVAAQQNAVRKAEQKLRVLEKLKEGRFAEWQKEADREQENLAAELHLAKWRRR